MNQQSKTTGIDRSKWVIFTCVAIAQFMVVLDTAIINVALPVIKRQLHFSNSGIQWVVTAYVLTFGGFLLFGGRTADLFGRRRMLLIGMIAFTVCSLLVGIAPSTGYLVVLRAFQGVAAGIMSPSALSIVLATFEEGHDRNQALGYWSMVATGGAAVGLLLGGVLTQYAGWRWNFFINVPVGVVMGLVIARVVPAHQREEERTTLDAPGAVLVTAGLMALIFYFSQAPAWGWGDARTIGALGVAIVLLAVFVVNEQRSKHPLVTLSIFKNRNLSGANVMMGALYAGNLGMFFLMTLYLQDVERYSAIKTGLAFLPFPIILGAVSSQLRRFIVRHGYKRYLVLGPALVAIGMAWLCFLPLHGSYLEHVLPSLLVMPVGYGMSFAPMYAAATSGVPARQGGLASGLITTSQQMGGAVGLAVLSGIAASFTASLIHDSVPQALTSGYNLAMAICVGFTVLALAVATAVIRAPKPGAKPSDPRQAADVAPTSPDPSEVAA
ncbi:MAG: EmrB/QacA subfamily drug resistance transporter [Acidimicrobiaceae bacterium]|nr:EmrB/QacA subfamily drug resistance transporter [Acidimicrobiaceae bacterium]